MKKFLIIADDFTGANDTGVQLRRRGMDIEVLLDLNKDEELKASYVLDTESRNVKEEEAFIRTKDKLNSIFKNNFDVVYKKIDSTLRGNIIPELIAMDEEYKPDIIIFAPAFPDINRTTISRIHMLNNIRITETEISKDLYKPVLEDDIYKLLRKGFDKRVVHYGLNDIRNDNVRLVQGFVYTFDIENNEDLQEVVLKGIISGKKVLWVGSAGMLDFICEIIKPFLPSLGVIGSVNEVSMEQLKYCESKGTNIIKIDIENFCSKRHKYIERAIQILNEKKDVIITTSCNKEDYYKSIRIGQEKGFTKEKVGKYVQNILSELSEEIIKNTRISGIFITGGDTAIGFIKKINAVGSIIIGEMEIGVPFMKVKGGKFDGLKMVTKAGGFGGKRDIFLSMRKLKEEI
ncbi:four-carbon acid sugar kinase family protein [Clostridium massiliodielmoense]|uniref:four-carbon acid sugar kinase family protein n=1 Tax=Clostridium massiliodielmoense TaxID=1776385 RepID=UPI0004D7594E|nr:four-carbon acid sugar kinase family protein [Clostridium massiliodielmoense]KEH98722.1 hypothetical protein Z962_11175 [Clostridium botulinum C/D str. BKT12695]